MSPVPVILVGCGAVARQFYLPALREAERLGTARVVALVDPAAPGRATLARAFPAAQSLPDLASVSAPEGTLAIVASPPRHHREQTLAAFARGWHVLCEKPLAASADDADAMVAASARTGRLLAAGHYKRFFPAHAWLRAAIAAGDSGPLGPLRSVRIREGGKFSWPAAGDSFFRREQTPGGVLLDIGVHVLDLLLWWLGEPTGFTYEDDARDGLEANARLAARFHPTAQSSPVTLDLRLSRDWATNNTYVFRFAHATVTLRVNDANHLALELDGLPAALAAELRAPDSAPLATNPQSFVAQLLDVCASIREARPPAIPGEAGARALRWIERCYAARRPLPEKWQHPLPPLPA
jgi:predicted dehydrogenase